jgi:hypothetical protein
MNARTAVARTRIGVAPVLAAALAAALLLGSCLAEKKNVDTPTGGGGGGGTAITWADLTASGGALNPNCSCHNSASGAAGLSLLASKYTAIVIDGQTGTGGIRIVAPGNSAGSLLFQKVDTGGSMALHTNASGVADIKGWIDAGAPEN